MNSMKLKLAILLISFLKGLNSTHKNLSGINSILKGRNSQRIKNSRKISFGDVQFSY